MTKLRVHTFSVSLEGYGAGPGQSLDHPLGVRGLNLHNWIVPTRTFQRMEGLGDDGETGLDDSLVAEGFEGIGATIMGRNMFGPLRGSWPDESWTGWWGDNPPYHHDVFVLTSHPRPALKMEGGTTFHFVTEGIQAALERASEAAGGLDIRLGGGVSTIKQYLDAGLVDMLHVAIVPMLLGTGERLFSGDWTSRYECAEYLPSAHAAHLRLVPKTLR